MPTILDKDVIRESTVKVNEREIQITLTDKQTIFMKLKGMKSGGVEISILDLFNKLNNGGVDSNTKETPTSGYKNGIDLSTYKGDDRFLISLHDIRSHILIKDIDMNAKLLFESLLVDLINERKTKVK